LQVSACVVTVVDGVVVADVIPLDVAEEVADVVALDVAVDVIVVVAVEVTVMRMHCVVESSPSAKY